MFDPLTKKVRAKPKLLSTNEEHTPVETLLFKEVRGLMKLIGITNEFDLQQGIRSLRKPKKKHFLEVAGLMSNQTAEMLEKQMEIDERIKQTEEAQKKFNSYNYSTLMGNSHPFAPRDPTMTVPHKMLPRVFSDFSTKKGDVGSFKPERDLDIFMKHSLHFDKNGFTRLGPQTSTVKDSREKFDLMSREFFGKDKEPRLGNFVPNSRTSIFQDSGKNILQRVNLEYAKLLK